MPITNVFGPPGTGKTFYFSQKKDMIYINHDILKTREGTIDFFEKMNSSKLSVVIDDYDSVSTCIGLNSIPTDTKTEIYILSETRLAIGNPLQLPRVTAEEFSKHLGKTVTEEELKNENYNMHIFKQDFSWMRDRFFDSYKYIENLASGKIPFHYNKVFHEHGHCFGIVHENYIDATNLSIDTCANMYDSLSTADMFDSLIYSQKTWDVVPFFINSACFIPSLYIRPHTFTKLRPGSMWTKFSNMSMKQIRLKKLNKKIDDLRLIVLKANAGDPLTEITQTYDLDTINQLSLDVKIKPKIMNGLKKIRKLV